MALTIEDAKAFITEAEKARENWLSIAKRSWDEIKKRQRNGKLWSVSPNSVRRRNKYPAWYSIFKIRQSLVLSRLGIPICKDTTQDGNDGIGATGAVLRERLAINLAKTFPMLDTMCASRDDFLATNFALCRAYYQRDEVKERVKEYITPQKAEDEFGQPTAKFIDSNGEEVGETEIRKDDEGFFIYHDETVDIENEKVCLEPLMYNEVYIDPAIRRWSRCRRIAFETAYSIAEFKDIFGVKAYLSLSAPDNDSDSDAKNKRQDIKVFEYWDFYEKEVYWFAENSSDFIRPKGYRLPNEVEENETGEIEARNGLYDLDGFFPCPPPLIMNSPTDEFWPIPEYYQLMEIFDEIHTIFSRMMETTRAYRARLLFDSGIEGLSEAINEMPESGAIGISNLTKALVTANGDIKNVAQYVPTEGIIASLQQLYVSLEQRLNTVYRLTGISDMLQGLASDQTQRTFGERQMTEKYALNQLEEPQRKMQEYVRDCYELITEMALKNFKDSSLDIYMIPATLAPKDKENYVAAREMLKQNSKRFRIELETDSTIALNEQYDKQMRIELANTLTSALEKTASIAESSPELANVELHALKYLIQGFRQAKMFQSEIIEAIDNVIEKTKAAAEAAANSPAPFDKDQVMAQLKAQEQQSANQLATFKLQSENQLAQMELAQRERLESMRNQLEAMKIQAASATDNAKTQIDYQALIASVNKAREELAIKQQELALEYQKVAGNKDLKAYELSLKERFGTIDAQLAQAQQVLEQRYGQMDMQERWATEQRLQAEHRLNELIAQVDVMAKMKDSLNAEKVQIPTVQIQTPTAQVSRTDRVHLNNLGQVAKIESTSTQAGL